MALKKITDLPLTTGANLTDLFEKTSDPSGSPLTESINLTQIQTLFGNTFSTITSLNNTGVDLLNLINNLSEFDLSSFALNADTGEFIVNAQTGIFYPSYNPSGFITVVDLTSYVTTGQISSFATIRNDGTIYVPGGIQVWDNTLGRVVSMTSDSGVLVISSLPS
jgi:hypothetical protein